MKNISIKTKNVLMIIVHFIILILKKFIYYYKYLQSMVFGVLIYVLNKFVNRVNVNLFIENGLKEYV